VLATLQLNKFEKFIYQGNEGKSENVIPSPLNQPDDLPSPLSIEKLFQFR
jgi:hypothetical protein